MKRLRLSIGFIAFLSTALLGSFSVSGCTVESRPRTRSAKPHKGGKGRKVGHQRGRGNKHGHKKRNHPHNRKR